MSNSNNTVIINIFYLNIRFCDFCLICQASNIKCIVICTSVSSIKILNFSISLYYDKNGLKTKHSGSSHLSTPGNNTKRKCISSSTRFNLHISQNRSLAGTLSYLSVYIAKGSVPLLNGQNIGIINIAYD